jgi:hypothetical protein
MGTVMVLQVATMLTFNWPQGYHHFMWQDDIRSVVRFVAECLDILHSAVAASHQP